MDTLIEEMISKLASEEAEMVLPCLPKESLEELYEDGYLFYEAGKFTEALNHFRLLTLFEAHHPRNWMGLGASHQMLRQFEQALEAYRIALLLDPENPSICVHASECYFGLNEIKHGLEALKYAEAIADNKDHYKPLISQLAFIRKRWSNRGLTKEV